MYDRKSALQTITFLYICYLLKMTEHFLVHYFTFQLKNLKSNADLFVFNKGAINM